MDCNFKIKIVGTKKLLFYSLIYLHKSIRSNLLLNCPVFNKPDCSLVAFLEVSDEMC